MYQRPTTPPTDCVLDQCLETPCTANISIIGHTQAMDVEPVKAADTYQKVSSLPKEFGALGMREARELGGLGMRSRSPERGKGLGGLRMRSRSPERVVPVMDRSILSSSRNVCTVGSSNLEIATRKPTQCVQVSDPGVQENFDKISSIIKCLESESRGLEAKDISRKCNIGDAKRFVNPLLYHLEKKQVVISEQVSGTQKKIWKLGPKKASDQQLIEYAAEKSNKTRKGPVGGSVTAKASPELHLHKHYHQHTHKNYIQIGEVNTITVPKVYTTQVMTNSSTTVRVLGDENDSAKSSSEAGDKHNDDDNTIEDDDVQKEVEEGDQKHSNEGRDIYLLGYQCLTSLVLRDADVKAAYVAPTHQDMSYLSIRKLVHSDVDSELKKHALIHLSHQLSRQILGIDKGANFIVWPGTNLETGEIYFICLHKGPLSQRLKVYFGIKIYYKDSEKLERSIPFPRKRKLQYTKSLTYWDASFIQQAIEEHGDNLFRKHSNLEAMSGSSFATSKSEGIVDCHVVVLYCRVKGFKPYGEDSFPESLQVGEKSIKVDVREGIFRKGMLGRTDWHERLCMGISIGISSDDAVAGTIGPFVQQNEKDKGFLTCAHVIKPSHLKPEEHFVEPHGLYVLQPPNGELLPNQRKSFQETCCGEVFRYIFNSDFHDPLNGLTKCVGVDAALVTIMNRDMDVNKFPFIALTDLKKAGFDPKYPPVFKHQSTKYPLDFKKVQGKRVIKYGRTTGLTKGSMLLDGAMVKVHDSELELPSKSKVVMKGQYIVEKHGSTAFFDLGDSGSGVFMIDKENKLTCIGLAIGVLDEQHDLQCVVTPIEYVLKALGLNLDSLKIHEEMDIGE